MTGMIEKVYSEALFEVAEEKNTLEDTYNELTEVSQIFNQNPEFIKLLSSPVITADEKKQILCNIFKGKVSEDLFNFINILTDKNRIKYIGRITEEFKNDYNRVNGIIEVSVTTSVPLKKELSEKLIKKLESETGKKINLVEKVDKSILGGIVLSYGNTQLDSSIKSKLEKIHSQIKSVIA